MLRRSISSVTKFARIERPVAAVNRSFIREKSSSAASPIPQAGAAPQSPPVFMSSDMSSKGSAAPKPPAAPKAPQPRLDIASMSDEQLAAAVDAGQLKFFNLEKELGDLERAVRVRRLVVERKMTANLHELPYQNYDYNKVAGQCCENVIGIVPIPVGVAGPILIDGKEYFLPMATTEGALVASTTRGCKALSVSGGVTTAVTADGMSRAPVLAVPSITVANQIKEFIETNFEEFAAAFNSTSRFARLKSIQCFIAGRKLFLRFKCSTGDAMGMNMVGKGVDHALNVITSRFPDVHVLALSGNVCTDKKPSAINWIEGRGKSVVAEAIIKEEVVKSVLKTSVEAIIETNYAKNLVGSAIAGSIGGQNAHASNIVTAMFLATGQDPAQNVESSNCMTLLERGGPENRDLYMSVTMPSIEVGAVGGGTSLPGQSSMLSLLGVKGSHPTNPGQNAKQLARIIASAVMAGELSLIAALSSGHLISSHMKLNRKSHPSNVTATPAANTGSGH